MGALMPWFSESRTLGDYSAVTGRARAAADYGRVSLCTLYHNLCGLPTPVCM